MATSYTEHKKEGTPRVRIPPGSGIQPSSQAAESHSQGVKIQAPRRDVHSRSKARHPRP